MSKIRINELARQLEVKSREVIDKLHELGIAERVTHSSSIDEDVADKLRRYYRGEPITQESAAPSRNGSGKSAVLDHRVEEQEVPPVKAEPAPPSRTAEAPAPV